MSDTKLIPAAVFIFVLVFHAVWSFRPAPCADGASCTIDAQGQCASDPTSGSGGDGLTRAGLDGYLQSQDYFLSLAYALAFAFATYSVTQFRRRGRRAAIGAAGGIGIGAALMAAVCFLVGCCGSPMLAVWISLFGAKATGVAKPIILAVTVLSIALVSLYMRRGCDSGCCGSVADCSSEPASVQGATDAPTHSPEH